MNAANVESKIEAKNLRSKIRESLPINAFEPQPMRGIAVIMLTPVVITASWTIVAFSPPWYVSFLLAIVIGQIYAIWGFAGHEAIHGSIFKSNFGKYLLGYLGYTPFLISPTTWNFWHCQCHHGHTNSVKLDPDVVGTLDEFLNSRITRIKAMFTPGSHSWMSYLGLLCGFTLEGQYTLWFYEPNSDLSSKYQFNRFRARVETVLIFLFWISLSMFIGARASLFIIILPMVIGNLIYLSYILTQHLLRPTDSNENNPIENTVSVKVHPILNFLHLNAGFHVEHHLFPNMSPKFAPLVSKSLDEYLGNEYVAVDIFKALKFVLRTPRIRLDDDTLIIPHTDERVKLSSILSAMTE
jgi:fatty acid desaturase